MPRFVSHTRRNPQPLGVGSHVPKAVLQLEPTNRPVNPSLPRRNPHPFPQPWFEPPSTSTVLTCGQAHGYNVPPPRPTELPCGCCCSPWPTGPGRPGPPATVPDSLTQEAYLSWRGLLAWRTVRARAVHVGARAPSCTTPAIRHASPRHSRYAACVQLSNDRRGTGAARFDGLGTSWTRG